MLKYKKIKYKNILSTGNQFIEFSLDQYEKCLFMGLNSNGKSTILDAICFVQFGKAYRNINIPQLTNSINGSSLEVHLTVERNGKEYLIVRGLSPKIFNIYENGILLNQGPSTVDYQKILEEKILKHNYITFKQKCVLGIDRYVPFMELTPKDRRTFVEKLLGIEVFQQMNVLTKAKLDVLETKIEELQRVEVANEKTISLIETSNSDLKKIDQESLLSIDAEILEKQSEVTEQIEPEIESLTEKGKEINKNIKKDLLLKYRSDLKNLSEEKSTVIYDEKLLETENQFFAKTRKCKTCKQEITESHKNDICSSISQKKEENQETLQILSQVEKTLREKILRIEKKQNELESIENELDALSSRRKFLQKEIDRKISQKAEVLKRSSSKEILERNEEQIRELTKKNTEITAEILRHREEKNMLYMALTVLKDGGVKSSIVKNYIPIINAKINEYLNDLNLFINFELNEKFEETIKSRHRDEFSYASFSNGQRKKIDLAILFSWLEVAKVKNSLDTNLLILDEIFDSGLDHQGIDNFMTLLDKVSKDKNVIIISPKGDLYADKFNNVFEFKIKENFTTVNKI